MDNWLVTCSGLTKKIQDDFEKSFEYTALLLSEHERDLLRSFKARLNARLSEFSELIAKREEAASSWIARVQRLDQVYDKAKEIGDKFEAVNAQLSATNEELRKKTRAAGKRNKNLVEELVLIKKRREALHEECDQVISVKSDAPMSSPSKRVVASTAPAAKPDRGEQLALQRLIEQERAKLLERRQNHAASLRHSNDLRELLRLYCQSRRSKVEKLQCRKPTTPRPRSFALIGPNLQFHSRERIVDQYELQLRLVARLGQLAFPLSRRDHPSPTRRRRPQSAFATPNKRQPVPRASSQQRQRPRSAAVVRPGQAFAGNGATRVPNSPHFSSLRRGADGRALLFLNTTAKPERPRGEAKKDLSLFCKGDSFQQRRRPSTAR